MEQEPLYKQIAAYRKLMGVKQTDLNNFLGYHGSTYSEKERGLRDFTTKDLDAICDYLGLELRICFSRRL